MLTTLFASIGWFKSRDLIPVFISHVRQQNQIQSQLEKRFSQGEQILISTSVTPAKELAVDAFAQGNYRQAASMFAKSLNTLLNDPETLIYLNNARIAHKKTYSIAVAIPIGTNINAAQEILRGVAQAQQSLNQEGGFDGIPLNVQIINDDNNPDIAQQVATVVGRNQEILGVIGHYASDVTIATAKIYQSHQLVAVSPVSTSVELSNLSSYLFRTVPSDHIAARALANHMLDSWQQKKVAVFYNSQSNYSQSLKAEFITAVALGGGQVTNTFDLSDANFSAADSLEQAIAGNAKVIMLAANTASLDQALQVIQVNRQRLNLLGGDDVYTAKTLQVAGDSAQGLVLAIPWHMKSNPHDQFSQTARKLWGGEINWRTAMAYDAAQALIAAINRSSPPNRVTVQKALSDPNFTTAGAHKQIDFLPSGDRPKQIELVEVASCNGSSFHHEFVPIRKD